MDVTGYHGTDKSKAMKIMRTEFKPGKNSGWLGNGIYFFENNMNLALRFIDKDVDFINRAVISARIATSKSRVLDITQVGSIGLDEFHVHREHVIDQVGAENVRIRTKQRHLDAFVLNDLCRRRGYYAVRAQTYTYSTRDKRFKLSSRFPNGIELCVKNASIISNKQLIDHECAV